MEPMPAARRMTVVWPKVRFHSRAMTTTTKLMTRRSKNSSAPTMSTKLVILQYLDVRRALSIASRTVFTGVP